MKIARGEVVDEAEAAPGLAAGADQGVGVADQGAAAGVAVAQGVVLRAKASLGADPAVEVTPGARAAQSLGVGPGPDPTPNHAVGADPETGTFTNVPRASHP